MPLEGVELDAGSGGATIATDTVGGLDFQVVKLAVGADGSADLIDNSNPIPVSDAGGTLTVDGTVTANLGATDNAVLDAIAASVAGTLTVGSHAVTNAGTFAVQATGTVDLGATDNAVLDAIAASVGTIDNAISGNEMQVDVLTMPTVTVNAHAVTNAGTFVVQENGAALTALQLIDNLVLAEDAVHSSGAAGILPLVVRQDSQSDLAADGDYVPMTVDADGGLRVSIVAGAGSGGTAVADDADFVDGTTSLTPIGGVYESSPSTVTDGDIGMVGITVNRELKVAISSGGVSGIVDDAAFTAGTSEGVLMLGVASSDTVDANDAGALAMTTSRELKVSLTTALPAGTAAIGKLAANSGVDIGDVDVTSLPNVTLAAGTNTNEVVGDAAHDAAAAGNPILTGAYASAAAPSDVSGDGDAVRLWALRNGSQVVNIAAAGALIGATSNALDVNIKSGAGSGGTAMTDDAAFTPGTTSITPVGAMFDDVAPDSVNEGDGGVVRMSANRNLYVTIRDAAGNERGLNVDAAGAIAVASHAVTNAGTFAVQNTAQASTNTQEMVGDAAHDAAAAGNPLLMGAYASAAAPSDVSGDADAVRLWALRNGSQVVNLAYGGTLVTATTVQETVGDVADDAATAGNPVLIGGVAVETDGTDPTTVSAEGDAAYLRTDRARRLLVSQHHPRGWFVSADYGSAQTNTSVKAAPGAGLKLYVTDIVVSNGATAGNVTLLDGSGGTVLFEIYPAINGGISFSPKTPIVLTANTALCITSTTVTTHSINIGGYIAP